MSRIVAAPAEEQDGKVIQLFRERRRTGQNEYVRLERALARVRKLLNDPEALRRRADELLEGTARSILALAIVGVTAVRMVGGPAAPGYFTLVPRRPAVVMVVPAPPNAEVA